MGAPPMSGSQIFVVVFAAVSIGVSLVARWHVSKISGLKGKPFWIAGSLVGFGGFTTSLSLPGDLYISFGLQIPVVMLLTKASAGTVIKAMFPFIAVVALAKCHWPKITPGI
ncbi:hypothetical protein O6V14_10365 [Sphingomonas faeni]